MHRHKIRYEIKTACLQLDPLVQKQATDAIIKSLLAHPRLQSKQHIGIYYPSDHEINIKPWLTQAWIQGHPCYLPITLENQLLFGSYTPMTALQPNRWGIIEPQGHNDTLRRPESLDIVLVPLVAFDKNGYRLGRGKGYYDRTFSFLLEASQNTQPYLIGLAYDLQQVDQIVPAAWDVPLNEVITETQHYCFYSQMN